GARRAGHHPARQGLFLGHLQVLRDLQRRRLPLPRHDHRPVAPRPAARTPAEARGPMTDFHAGAILSGAASSPTCRWPSIGMAQPGARIMLRRLALAAVSLLLVTTLAACGGRD